MSLGKIFKFAKPKNRGYGISKNFYITVLSGSAQLPTPHQFANPKAEDGAIEGLLAPLMPGSTKEDLRRPMERGVYALASRDRKTVLKLHVLSKEEAGFDPEAIARSSMASALSPEVLNAIRATWTIVQLTFETHDAMVSPSLAMMFGAVRRLCELSDSVVADPISQRYMLRADLPLPAANEPPQALDHLTVTFAIRDGVKVGFTLGMQKFGLPEFEIRDLGPSDNRAVQLVLASVAQARLDGRKLDIGDRVGKFDLAPGGLDRGQWEGISVIELIPARGMTVSEALKDWLLALDAGRIP